MKILLIAGHGDGDSGACGNGCHEADLTREVAALLAPKLNEICDVTVADTNRNWFEWLKKHSFDFTAYDYVLEIHFNSFNTQAHGTEIFVPVSRRGSTGVETAIVEQMCAAGKYLNRGVKRYNWNNISKAQAQGVNAALLEVCFIDHSGDMATYKSKKNDIVDAIVNGIAEGYGLTRKAPARHWAAVAHDKLKAQGYVSEACWERYDADIRVAHALALLDNISGGRWNSPEADKSIHEAQPIIISLCGKGIITDKELYLGLVKRNANLSKALCLALFDGMFGGMVEKYKDRDTDHWGRNCLDSLCDKKIITTPGAWTNFEGAATYGLIMALTCSAVGI